MFPRQCYQSDIKHHGANVAGGTFFRDLFFFLYEYYMWAENEGKSLKKSVHL